jgi:hypothetical protein
MPKRMLLIALVVTSLALAACGDTYNPNDLYGTPVPTASPTPVTTPNPTISEAPVTVTYAGAPVSNLPVNLYTDVNGHVGTLLATQNTSSLGQTTFTGLKPASNYCFDSVYTPPAAGATQETDTLCGDLWGFGVFFNF